MTLSIAGLLIVLMSVIIVPRLRLPFTAASDLGCMSDRWLAEQRAAGLH